MRGSIRSVLLWLGVALLGLGFYGCQSAPSKSEPEGPESAGVTGEDAPVRDAQAGEIPSVEEAEQATRRPVTDASENVKVARSFAMQAGRWGAEVIHEEGSHEWQARKDGRVLIVKEGSRTALLDGVTVFLDSPMSQYRGRWVLSPSDEAVILSSAFGASSAESRRVRTVVIDPGHGGSEDGTKNESLGLREKDLNLEVSERLQTHLEDLGYRTVLTRYDDRQVSLEERPNIANGARGDLFVSIHFNAALNKKAQGLETYMLTPAGQVSTLGASADDDLQATLGNQLDRENFELAYRVQRELIHRLQRTDRGVKKARFRVLKTLKCPGILVEGGFLSNGDEALLLSTAGYRERLARGLAEAIDAYAKNQPLGKG